MYRFYFIFLFFALLFSSVSQAVVDISFWHAMTGKVGVVLQEIVDDFNQQNPDYHVNAIYKGDYTETLTSTVAGFRAGQHPVLVQVSEIGTATMLFPAGATISVKNVMDMAGVKPKGTILPVVRQYYSDNKKNLLALPFNASAPVMYYNKDAFEKVGIKSDNIPKTWGALEKVSRKLIKNGYKCGFTTNWPSWVMLENFTAWHNLPFAEPNNGFTKLENQVVFNQAAVVDHVQHLSKWQNEDVFQYGGRDINGTALFVSGHCPVLFASSGAQGDLRDTSPFDVGIGALPYWPNISKSPQNTFVGGAAIWVMTKHSTEQYKGAGKFLSYLLSDKVQAKWSKETGYIPVTEEAILLLKQKGYWEKNPSARVALNMLTNKLPTKYSRGIRLGSYMQIRQINEAALEAAISGEKNAKDALDQAVELDNRLLKQFAEIAKQAGGG